MKKIVLSIAFASLVLSTVFISCQSSASKESAAEEDVKNAKEELIDAKKDAQAESKKAATAEEWATFKKESEVKIGENELRITELKAKKDKKGKTFDSLYAKRIETLEQKNAELKSRIYGYEKEQSDWESFKREFNHDMDELGTAIKDFTVDNKS